MKESHSSCLFEDGFPIVILGPSDHPIIFKIGLWNKSSYRGSVSRFQPILEGGVLIHAIFLNISPLHRVCCILSCCLYAQSNRSCRSIDEAIRIHGLSLRHELL